MIGGILCEKCGVVSDDDQDEDGGEKMKKTKGIKSML